MDGCKAAELAEEERLEKTYKFVEVTTSDNLLVVKMRNQLNDSVVVRVNCTYGRPNVVYELNGHQYHVVKNGYIEDHPHDSMNINSIESELESALSLVRKLRKS